MRNLVGVRDQRTVSSAANAIEEKLHHRASAIRGIAIRADESDNYYNLLLSVEFLLADFDLGIAILDNNGNLQAYSGSEYEWGIIEAFASDLIADSTYSSVTRPMFSNPFVYQGEYFSIVYYQSDPQSLIAVGVFSIRDLAANSLAGSLTYDNKGTVILVNQQGNLLYQSGHLDLAENPETHPGVMEALSGESGTTYFKATDGEHVVAYSPIRSTNWGLIIEEPWATVASPLLRYSETGSLVLLPIAIFSVFALWFGTKQIIQPLSLFRKQAEDFSQGNYQAFEEDVGGISEIRVLHSAFIEMANEVENAQRILKRFLELVTTGQEEERKRLARELHDDTLQSLIALNQRVMLLKRKSVGAGIDASLSEIERMIVMTMNELRRFTQALRPIYLEDLGLVTALEALTREMTQLSDIHIGLNSEGDERRLADSVEIALFRISQEALNNILRHSGASHALVSIDFSSDEVRLEISDNGKGFTPPENPGLLANLGHFGLLGIYERAELIGARIIINSKDGHGTRIIVNNPY